LGCDNNNLPKQDLSFLKEAINLEELYLGNRDEDKINQGIYNHWVGSLDYLSRMKKLIMFSVNNTDFDKVNADNLPRSLKKIAYSIDLRPSCQLTKIISLLESVKYG
jgi:hypothetical protein